MQTTYIYTLSDPSNQEVKYLGRTIDLTSRYAQHIRRREGTKKDNWVESLHQRGLKPKMEVLEEVPLEDWAFWESYWIHQLLAWGFDLTNISKGCSSKGVDGNIKPCSKYDLDGKFLANYGSWSEAATELGVTASRICNSVKSQQPVRGYLWARGKGVVGDSIPVNKEVITAYLLKIKKQEERKAKPILPRITPEYRQKQREKSIGNLSSICTPIVQYTVEGVVIQEWRSMNLAALNSEVSLYKLKQDLNTGTSKFTGYIWKKV